MKRYDFIPRFASNVEAYMGVTTDGEYVKHDEAMAEIDKKQYAINLALELVRQMDSTKFDSTTAEQYEQLQCHLEMSTA